MNRFGQILFSLAITMALVFAGCAPLVKWATREPVTWKRVISDWRQPTVHSSKKTGKKLEVVLNINTESLRMHSSNNYPEITKVSTRLGTGRIFIRFYHSLALRPCEPQVTFLMKAPPSGNYTLVYDDDSAGFPTIGTIQVD